MKQLIRLLTLTDKGVFDYAERVLQCTHDVSVQSPYFLLALPKKQKFNVLMMAHVDTVAHTIPQPILLAQNIINKSHAPLGGDDRCGVWMVLQLAKLGAPILLTNYEETGGAGANVFIKSEKSKTIDPNLVVSFDRRGRDAYVHYLGWDSIEIKQLMKKYKIKEEIGSWSDVATIAEHYDVADINLSAAFYNEHTPSELIDIKALFDMEEKYTQLLPELAKIGKVPLLFSFKEEATFCPYCGCEIYQDEFEVYSLEFARTTKCPQCSKLIDTTWIKEQWSFYDIA